ncbi:MAG: hypothetical protein KME01_02115 [Chroococcus sp. CMT-3BRIN-NPC107]|jgi:hypothetical protein|nr:hypothetical protein [Chroococcus sp. CMT-3BRIN-NPC107]
MIKPLGFEQNAKTTSQLLLLEKCDRIFASFREKLLTQLNNLNSEHSSSSARSFTL